MKTRVPYTSSFSVIVLFIAVALVGLALLPRLTVKLFPTRNVPGLSVTFPMQGSSARVVEIEATSKLEGLLANIKGVKSVSSFSEEGRGQIQLLLDKHAEVDKVRLEVSALIRQSWGQLPRNVGYPSIATYGVERTRKEPETFMEYKISAPVRSSEIAQWVEQVMRPRISVIEGVRKVSVAEGRPMEWVLEYDHDYLSSVGVEVDDIAAAVGEYNRKESLGLARVEDPLDGVERTAGLFVVSGGKGMDASFHPERIDVVNREGKRFRLDQLVNCRYREKKADSYYRINGMDYITLSIKADEEANQIRTGEAVKRTIAEIGKGLPEGFTVHESYDSTTEIRKELDTIYFRTFLTVLILLLFVLLTTGNAKYLLMIVLSLFFNLSIAVIFYYLLDIELQLYSLAGITISLSLIIDNTIIMADHYKRNRDRKVFMAILAATLTTIGALSLIFFVDEETRFNLLDFSIVVMVNLLTSLFTALLLVPALSEKLRLYEKSGTTVFQLPLRRRAGWITAFSRWYDRQIRLMLRYKVVFFILALFAFGMPTFLLPEHIDGEGRFARFYNGIFSSEEFKEDYRPKLDQFFGGYLRVFVQKVVNGEYYNYKPKVELEIRASFPKKMDMEQTDFTARQVEKEIVRHKGMIKKFTTEIPYARSFTIRVQFTDSAILAGAPLKVKHDVIALSHAFGGCEWTISGIDNQTFSDASYDFAGRMHINLAGYNYDELLYYAQRMRDTLLQYKRIPRVVIDSKFSSIIERNDELAFAFDTERMKKCGLSQYDFSEIIRQQLVKEHLCGFIRQGDRREEIVAVSLQSRETDRWDIEHVAFPYKGKLYKLSDFVTLTNVVQPIRIVKEDQQYKLCLQYDFRGSESLGERVQERTLKRFEEILPLGYTAVKGDVKYNFLQRNNAFFLLGIIILILFFMTSILFNSLKQPVAILLTIPIAYIGIFMTFYHGQLIFDQGGFASFVLLSGITVNASIYIINEYNQLNKRNPGKDPLQNYIRAWNHKIIPIILTVLSTVLGFVPFLVGTTREGFWFPLAAGTSGGLLLSLVGIYFFLPLFLFRKKAINEINKK